MTTQTLEKIETEVKTTPMAIAEAQTPALPQYENGSAGMMKLLEMAIAGKADMDTLKKLMELKKEYDAGEAKKAFDEAMSAFQGECPIIQRKKAGSKTNSGQTVFHYAPLEDIVCAVRPLLSKYGFSYLFREEKTEDGQTRVVCVATHKQGHSEKSDQYKELGTKTNLMSNQQHQAAALTFSKRYAFTNVFGIVVGGEDNENALKEKAGKAKTAQEMPTEEARGVVKEYSEIAKLVKELCPSAKNQQQAADFVNRTAGTDIASIQKLTPNEGKRILATLLAAKGGMNDDAPAEALETIDLEE